MIRAVEHIAIAAQDTGGLARWYCDTLGFRAVVEGGPQGTWFVGPPESEAIVEIVPATSAPRVARERNDPGWSHLAFTVSDFDAVCDSLRAKGVTFTDPPRGGPGENRLAFFLDLEGNVLQLVQRPRPLGS
jgi:catechol 2,3-dioxygenase-like lactoylglutathione lyase family enzyme